MEWTEHDCTMVRRQRAGAQVFAHPGWQRAEGALDPAAMMRPPFAGHRRYSITHRAVQRLRELVPGRDEDDDESLRDKLDAALAAAEDSGKAIRTLDAMLGEPQTLIPVDAFGDVLYAIIKEDTVVTVLPQGHGEEILQRGQAMEQRVAAGQATMRPQEDERWDRRRWRKDATQPVVIERIIRNGPTAAPPASPLRSAEADSELGAGPPREPQRETPAIAKVMELPERPAAQGPVAELLAEALAEGQRRAAVAALTEVLRRQSPEADLLPLWNQVSEQGAPAAMKVADLIEAVRALGE